jgi:tRNA (guanine37-N1)-methyltransferase
MKIDILTLFPEMFEGPFDYSIIKRAKVKGLAEINIHNLRKWTSDNRRTVDDKPYGGGVGMVMMVEPIDLALRELKLKIKDEKLKVVLLSPRGKVFNQQIAQEFSKLDHLILICGHYEGVDERVSEYLIDEEISIGDYVLTGGEIPAMILTDSVIRLIPGVLEKSTATTNESFSNSQLEYPQYTRPENYKDWKVPEILLSGDPKKIKVWQEEKAKEKTKKIRPDLF